MTALEIHKFYCLNCGREGLPIWRNSGQRRKQLHRKKLYCPWCKATLNHIEITSTEEEEKFKEDWKQAFPEGTLDRLYDTMTGYRSISTVSDFICYNYPNIYYIECKSHKGASFPFTNFNI